jgi:hypothetical protein
MPGWEIASHGALAQEGRRRAPRCIGRLVSIRKVALCQEPWFFRNVCDKEEDVIVQNSATGLLG